MDKNNKNLTNATPLLVAIPNTANSFYNLAPFLGKDHFLDMQENHFEFLKNVMKKCQRVVACSDVTILPINEEELKTLLYHLFELETMFEKCTIVNA